MNTTNATILSSLLLGLHCVTAPDLCSGHLRGIALELGWIYIKLGLLRSSCGLPVPPLSAYPFPCLLVRVRAQAGRLIRLWGRGGLLTMEPRGASNGLQQAWQADRHEITIGNILDGNLIPPKPC